MQSIIIWDWWFTDLISTSQTCMVRWSFPLKPLGSFPNYIFLPVVNRAFNRYSTEFLVGNILVENVVVRSIFNVNIHIKPHETSKRLLTTVQWILDGISRAINRDFRQILFLKGFSMEINYWERFSEHFIFREILDENYFHRIFEELVFRENFNRN